MIIYLVRQQNSNLYKIGVTGQLVTERINQLQTANPETLILVNTFETKHDYTLETYVHRRYASQNVQLEWFELTDEQVKEFTAICQQGEANFNLLQEENTYLQDRSTKKTRKNYWN
jgi:hypothetical protein